jgi:hypothetical protein
MSLPLLAAVLLNLVVAWRALRDGTRALEEMG